MCRLMGFVSSQPESFADAVGENLKEFIHLSTVHCDGWGISTLDHGSSQTHLSRAPELAESSSEFAETLANTESDGALLHLRWATSGIPVSEDNTHPFTHEGFTFIHNGAIYPPNALEALVAPRYIGSIVGQTDSERYFYFLLTEINNLGLVEGVTSAVRKIRENYDFSSINAMLMTDQFFISICEHDPARKPDWAVDGYYELFYKSEHDQVVVASSGWDQAGWTNLPNHHILVVDRSSLTAKVLAL
jgi:predicted glutamine amidotransferase